MEQSTTVEIEAPPERFWEVLADVERWSEWAETVTWVRRLDEGPLRPGSRAEISQPKVHETEYVSCPPTLGSCGARLRPLRSPNTDPACCARSDAPGRCLGSGREAGWARELGLPVSGTVSLRNGDARSEHREL